VPLVLPHSPAPGYHASPRTGWEGRGVVESLRSLAGLDGSATPIRPETLPTFAHLPLTVQSSFPSKLKPTLRESPIPRPAPRMTRSNPRTWHHPIRLDKRLLRRSYARLWESLVWVHPGGEGEGDGWVKCGYGEMKDWEAGIQAGVNKAGSPGEGVLAIEEDREGEVKKRGKERKEKRGKKAESGEKVEGNGLERWSVGSEEDRKWLAETPNA